MRTRTILIVAGRRSCYDEILRQAKVLRSNARNRIIVLLFDADRSVQDALSAVAHQVVYSPVHDTMMNYYLAAHRAGQEWTRLSAKSRIRKLRYRGINLLECLKTPLMNSVAADLEAYKALDRLMERNRPSVVVLHNNLDGSYYGLACHLRSQGQRFIFDWSLLRESRLVRAVGRIADGVIVHSDDLAVVFRGISAVPRLRGIKTRVGAPSSVLLTTGALSSPADVKKVRSTTDDLFGRLGAIQVVIKAHPLSNPGMIAMMTKFSGYRANLKVTKEPLDQAVIGADVVVILDNSSVYDCFFSGRRVYYCSDSIDPSLKNLSSVRNFRLVRNIDDVARSLAKTRFAYHYETSSAASKALR